MFFFFNDTATTEIYTLSLHDALPIFTGASFASASAQPFKVQEVKGSRFDNRPSQTTSELVDRKSTRLNSSHGYISYAVFCLKKKKPGRFSARRQEQRGHEIPRKPAYP